MPLVDWDDLDTPPVFTKRGVPFQRSLQRNTLSPNHAPLPGQTWKQQTLDNG